MCEIGCRTGIERERERYVGWEESGRREEEKRDLVSRVVEMLVLLYTRYTTLVC